MDPELRSIIEELIQLDGTQRLGAKGTAHDMNALMAHPFFGTIDFNGDMAQLGIKELLDETEPLELKNRRL